MYIGYICLADYGLAKILVEDQNTLSFCGTPEYLGNQQNIILFSPRDYNGRRA